MFPADNDYSWTRCVLRSDYPMAVIKFHLASVWIESRGGVSATYYLPRLNHFLFFFFILFFYSSLYMFTDPILNNQCLIDSIARYTRPNFGLFFRCSFHLSAFLRILPFILLHFLNEPLHLLNGIKTWLLQKRLDELEYEFPRAIYRWSSLFRSLRVSQRDRFKTKVVGTNVSRKFSKFSTFKGNVVSSFWRKMPFV